jgi:signal transduction histidine kinase
VAVSIRRRVVFTLLTSVGLGMLVGALLTIGQGGGLWQFVVSSAVSTLYSVSIGVPATIGMARVRPRLHGRPELQQWINYVGVIVGATLLGTVFTRLVLVVLGLIRFDEMFDGFVQGLEISFAIGVPATVGAVTFSRLHKRLHDSEGERTRAVSLATEARLASLESRVRPHFLFNALNSAIALIPEDPRRAEDVLERLCGLLRFSLDAHTRLVSLREELRMVTDYLEIERVRFGERLSYTIDVPDELTTIEVPVFAVQTLVENSVKYAVAPRKHGGHIRVHARRVDGRLLLDVSDDGPGFVGPVWVPGHGLDGLRARLDALYGAEARLVAPCEAAAGAAVRIDLRAEAG